MVNSYVRCPLQFVKLLIVYTFIIFSWLVSKKFLFLFYLPFMQNSWNSSRWFSKEIFDIVYHFIYMRKAYEWPQVCISSGQCVYDYVICTVNENKLQLWSFWWPSLLINMYWDAIRSTHMYMLIRNTFLHRPCIQFEYSFAINLVNNQMTSQHKHQ